MLILLLATRVLWEKMKAAQIPRTSVDSPKHRLFISTTHVLMYAIPAGLVISGLIMISNIDIPLSILGIDLEKDMQGFIDLYPVAQNVHLNLITLIWWLIGIHVVGIMYAKK